MSNHSFYSQLQFAGIHDNPEPSTEETAYTESSSGMLLSLTISNSFVHFVFAEIPVESAWGGGSC